MPKVILTRGLPASGKSTWAKQFIKENAGWLRFNNDDYCEMLTGKRFGRVDGKFLANQRKQFVANATDLGHNVILDNTNLNPYTVKEVRGAVGYGVNILTVDFKADLETCITRDQARQNPVGKEVITGMVDRWGHLYDWL